MKKVSKFQAHKVSPETYAKIVYAIFTNNKQDPHSYDQITRNLFKPADRSPSNKIFIA